MGSSWYVWLAEIIDGNSEEKIIKQISHIRFRCLKGIYASGNTITSIEGIDRLDMPALEKIDISET